MRRSNLTLILITGFLLIISMQSCIYNNEPEAKSIGIIEVPDEIKIEAESFSGSYEPYEIVALNPDLIYVHGKTEGWISIRVNIEKSGRYAVRANVSSELSGKSAIWIEDYSDNTNDRTYNITGNMFPNNSPDQFTIVGKDGSPLKKGLHLMKVHFRQGVKIDWIMFSLIKEHELTPETLTQNMKGKDWKVVWSDEFDKPEVDTSKWTYDIGDWGWGNGEQQYYTSHRNENARIENGNLIIEARKDDAGYDWTSARLTTRGKVSFIYGKIEFRAKVPPYKGNWAAGWTLGDEYVDELSWPYCGEIDILESVGYEMNDTTGDGIAHASAHSGAYYFKLGNQPTGVVNVKNMNNEYHTYTVEWSPDEIKSFVDDRLYLTYNDTSTDLSWPFSKPQNIILNLAIGGGWGGYYGIDENVTSQKMTIDYIRVYELQ